MLKNIHKLIAVLAMVVFATTAVFAQNVVRGKVKDAESSYGLEGAAVLVSGTNIGTSTDENGTFTLDIPKSNFTLEFSYAGYATISKMVSYNGEDIDLGDISLNYGSNALSAVEVLASRSTSKTPFTSTKLDKKEISENLGSRDVPNVLNIAPSVYSTNQGGGAGDSRINLRGFDQRNISVMFNGIPTNDNENGWLYWSNYDGIGDAISSIEVQRGISPVNVATPSVGGTINIITDPASKSQGVSIQREAGSWNFQKTIISMNSGLIDDKFAVNALISRKTGDGFADGTFTDAWSWYLGASYQATEKDKFEFYAFSARQHHGQNLYAQNIGRYSHSYALGLGADQYDPRALTPDGGYKEYGRRWNQNYNAVDPSYRGEQYYEFYKKHRRSRWHNDFLMERHNYFQRPHVNVNYSREFSDKVKWNNTLYMIGGAGGGTGTWGDLERVGFGYEGGAVFDWNATIAANSNVDPTYDPDLKRSYGVLRNSVNQQRTFGAISKLDIELSEYLDLQIGTDWRSQKVDHWKEIRDLLGGDYYTIAQDVDEGDPYNIFDYEAGRLMKRLGDKVDYDLTNTIDWFGTHAQVTYDKNGLSLFGVVGTTISNYSLENRHYKDANDPSKASKIETDNFTGFQAKAGLKYEVNRNFNFYVNGGHISRTPIFDFVFFDERNQYFGEPENEKVTTFELGANLYSGNSFGLSINAYSTQWNDRTLTQNVRKEDGTNDFVFLQGLGQTHNGVEISGSWKPTNKIRFDFGGSYGVWEYAGNVNTQYSTFENGAMTTKDIEIKLDGLKVGGAPQQSAYIAATVNPIKNLSVKLDYRFYGDFYSNMNIVDGDGFTLETDTRVFQNDGVQSWQVPDYGVADLHIFYTVPTKSNAFSVSLFAHVFNLFDNLYIQDATDNSKYNAFDRDHDADDAEVFFGMPRNFNSGIRVNF